jgi:serine/threonine protein kinase
LERIRDLHSLGWVHNDIKLENILIGYKDPSVIYLIDFGLSQPFIEEKPSNLHIPVYGYNPDLVSTTR